MHFTNLQEAAGCYFFLRFGRPFSKLFFFSKERKETTKYSEIRNQFAFSETRTKTKVGRALIGCAVPHWEIASTNSSAPIFSPALKSRTALSSNVIDQWQIYFHWREIRTIRRCWSTSIVSGLCRTTQQIPRCKQSWNFAETATVIRTIWTTASPVIVNSFTSTFDSLSDQSRWS